MISFFKRIFLCLGKGIKFFFVEVYYLIVEYIVIIAPFMIAIFLPIPIAAKAILTILLLIVSISCYSRWRKFKTKKQNKNLRG